jgi:hypothetical protein
MLVYAVRLFNSTAKFDEYMLVSGNTVSEVLEYVNAAVYSIAFFNGITDIQQLLVPMQEVANNLSTFCAKESFNAGRLILK